MYFKLIRHEIAKSPHGSSNVVVTQVQAVTVRDTVEEAKEHFRQTQQVSFVCPDRTVPYYTVENGY